MRTRTIGRHGPEISQVTYGTMRLRAETDGRSAAQLLLDLSEAGIDTHHSSHEYDTHHLYLDALGVAKRQGLSFKHIVKLTSPNWEDTKFNPTAIRDLVDRELRSLGAETLVSVQWLFRTSDPQNDTTRIRQLREQESEIRSTFSDLIEAGKICDVSIFPYSVAFARKALEVVPTPTLCTYLNLRELEYVDLLTDLESWIAIRPLAGGEIVDQHEIAAALRFPLLHPKVATIIVSANQKRNVDQLLAATASVEPNEAKFLGAYRASEKAQAL